MTTHYLDKLFNPLSIAVIGASDKSLSVGAKVFSNLLQGSFTGEIYPVNPKHETIQDQRCFASIKDINQTIDLAVIVAPANEVPKIIKECGEKNVRQAIILSAGFGEANAEGKKLEGKIVEIAKQFQIRFIGPNCLGVMRPSSHLNATFENSPVIDGNLAFISQSGALCAAILDWAVGEQIGFSTVVSLGNSADIDFGEILDYLALDTKTECILLYIEGIHDARRFMTGLRAAACLKPIIAIKGGRHAEGTRAAISHTGAMIGADDVFDAALRRAGVVRVMSIKQLFSAAETFSSGRRTKGHGLTIITNGGGAGVMAADKAADLNIPLVKLNESTVSKLDSILPVHWSHQNPIDILGDATPTRFQEVISTCLKDEKCDGLITILIPVTMSQPLATAKELIKLSARTDKPIFACWMGQEQVKKSWDLFAKNKIPCFSTPETAIESFSYLVSYLQNQQLLLQIPEPISHQSSSDVLTAQNIISNALKMHRKILTTIESKSLLKAFGIPVTETMIAETAEQAANIAEKIGFPVVIKINSPDITHKQDVGGVQLNITNTEAVRSTFNQLIKNSKQKYPQANILGVTIEKMYKTPNDRELMVGILRDPVFGPTINFGAGGSLVEVMQDRAIALPPLNHQLIKDLIARTRIAKLLGDFRNKPAVNIKAIENLLLRVSEIVCELPQIQEMDINPLIVNDKEIMAVDARIVIKKETILKPYSHMAIQPYPTYLISKTKLIDGTPITIRPIRPEDAQYEQNFIRQLSKESRHFRFMAGVQELTPEMLKRTTQIDYDREMALVAIVEQDTQEKIMGIARYITNPDLESCEFALVVSDAWQHKGVGSCLMHCLIEASKAQNLKLMEGIIMANNSRMLDLAKYLGFEITAYQNDTTLRIATKSLI